MGIDIGIVDYGNQFMGGGLQSPQDIEPFPTRFSRQEETNKGPDKPQERLEDKMRRIDEEDLSLTGLRLFQARFELFF